MIKLYYAPRTRAVRVVWLLEELGIPYELERVDFLPPATNFFAQRTPLGKLPTITDGEVVMCESGAIVEYVLERYGNGRLAPAVYAPERARYLQWLHFAESTAFPPLGIIAWLSRYRSDAEQHTSLLEDARTRAAAGFEFLEREMGDNLYLVGDYFTAADVMMGFTLLAARVLAALDETHPRLGKYLERLIARPALQRTLALG